jgi:hypothetical protein
LSRELAVQLPLFVCLVFNPFVFDYLVAARGYALALGFLLCAILVSASWHLQGDSSRSLFTACAMSSACLGFSFSANFSFAFVNLFVLAAILWLACQVQAPSLAAYSRTLAACVIPGASVALFFTASVLMNWRQVELWYGSSSLHEMFLSILDASIYKVNPDLVNPALSPVFEAIKYFLFPALGVAVLIQLGVLSWERQLQDRHSKLLVRFGAVVGGVLILTILTHWLSFRLFNLLLPKDRTAIYIYPLAMITIGVISALPSPSLYSRLARGSLVLTVVVMAAYFLMCLRLRYFKEWEWNAEVKQVYSVLGCLNRNHEIKDLAATWLYVAPLNFYRLASGRESIAEIKDIRPLPAGKDAYVLLVPWDEKFIQANHLKVIRYWRWTEVAIAVKPELEAPVRAGTCN